MGYPNMPANCSEKRGAPLFGNPQVFREPGGPWWLLLTAPGCRCQSCSVIAMPAFWILALLLLKDLGPVLDIPPGRAISCGSPARHNGAPASQSDLARRNSAAVLFLLFLRVLDPNLELARRVADAGAALAGIEG